MISAFVSQLKYIFYRCKEDAMEDDDEEAELNKLVDILKVSSYSLFVIIMIIITSTLPG